MRFCNLSAPPGRHCGRDMTRDFDQPRIRANREGSRMFKKLVSADRQFDIEQFYYHEARLLDEHRYADWLELYSDDTRYWMPIRETRTSDDLDQEFGNPGDVA